MDKKTKNNHHNLQGERKDQLLVLCDKKGNPLGSETREKCHKGRGKTHLAFMAFVSDKENKIILCKRNPDKSLWGGCWDATVVSHILPKETPQIASKRRSREEIGVAINLKIIGGFYYFAGQNDYSENEYCFVLSGKTEAEIFENPVEIVQTKRISLDKLRKEVINNPSEYTPWLKIALNSKIDLSEI